MSKHAARQVIIRWDEGAPDESAPAYRVFDATTDEFVGGTASLAGLTRAWAEASGYEVAFVVLSDADQALVLDAAREQMERAIEDTRKAAEAEARAGLRHIAAVAAVLAPSATHVVLAMGDVYENPVYTVRLLVDNDVHSHPDLEDHVVWSWRGQTPEAREIDELLRLVQIDASSAEPLLREAIDEVEGDKVIRGAYLGGADDPIAIPLAHLR